MKKTAKAAVILLLTIMVLIVSCGEDPFFHYLTVRNDEGKAVTTIVVSGGDYTLPDKVEGLEDIEGWIYEDKEYAVGEVIKVTKDSEITAVTGTVIMVDNGNGTTQKVVVKKGQTTLTLPVAPERAGYDFDGWLVNGKLKEASASVEYTEGMTIKAVWTKLISITVNNGDGTTQTVNVREDAKEITLPEAPAERTGYVFDGWKIGETTYEAGVKAPYTEGMKISAIWTRYYTITYNANEGTGSVAAGKLREDNAEGIEIASGTPLSNGSLSFSGWNTQADGKGKAYAPGDVYKTKADLTLYAVWSSDISIIYMSEGGQVQKVSGSPADMKTWTPDSTVKKEGYQFDGWYTAQDGEGTYYANDAPITTSMTLYAHWVDENLSFTKHDGEVGYSVVVKSDKKSTVKNITIPSVWHGVAVTVVYNFKGCSKLTSVAIPSSVTKIFQSGFENCVELTTINFPESLTEIEFNAFKGCTALKKVEIKGNLTLISDEAFSGCTSLEEVSLPASIEKIDGSAFRGCTALASIDLSGTKVKSIEEQVFNGCTALSSIKLPSTLESIDIGVFSGCTSLKSIRIPKSIKSIHDDAFTGCTSLTIKMEMTEAEATAAKLATNTVWGADANSKVVWSYKAGDTVQRGTYPSTYGGDTSLRGGAVNWKVLYVDSANSRMLVISEKILDLEPFDDGSATSYEDADVLGSLNTIYSDYSLSSYTDILNVDANGNVGSGSSYKYKLFLLSEAEVNTYFGTDSKIAYYDADTSWWLRSFNYDSERGSKAGYVNTSGEIASDSVTSDLGIRPAMWISLSN